MGTSISTRESRASDIHAIRNVQLRQLSEVASELERQVRGAGFDPDCVVYLETGGRLLAKELCERFDVGTIALKLQRKGNDFKRYMARTVGFLPPCITDLLRRVEARWLWGRMSRSNRCLLDVTPVDLTGVKVLIADDAVDTGTSVVRAREWVIEMGASPDDICVVAITVTTEGARDYVDHTVFNRMCRFPWSSDSKERNEYKQLYSDARLPSYTRSTV